MRENTTCSRLKASQGRDVSNQSQKKREGGWNLEGGGVEKLSFGGKSSKFANSVGNNGKVEAGKIGFRRGKLGSTGGRKAPPTCDYGVWRVFGRVAQEIDEHPVKRVSQIGEGPGAEEGWETVKNGLTSEAFVKRRLPSGEGLP